MSSSSGATGNTQHDYSGSDGLYSTSGRINSKTMLSISVLVLRGCIPSFMGVVAAPIDNTLPDYPCVSGLYDKSGRVSISGAVNKTKQDHSYF